MRNWLIRLSYSFFIVGFVLIYQMTRLQREGGAAAWKVTVYLVAAIVCIGLGFVGVRERHRM